MKPEHEHHENDEPRSGVARLSKLIEPAVMAVLANEPLHGFLILQRLKDVRMFRGHPPDPAGVYRVLRGLEERGMIAGTWNLGDAGPARRSFTITAAGRLGLERWSQALREYAASIDELLTTMGRRGIADIFSGLPPQNSCDSQNMLSHYSLDGERIDSMDLKVLLLTQGMSVREEVFRAYSGVSRISPDPLECSSLLLPDRTVVHIANIGPSARFQLALGEDKRVELRHGDKFLAEVSFPKVSKFYQQVSSGGVRFRGMAVLQGEDVLSFPYLWPCEFAKRGKTCKFCHCGFYTQHQITTGVTPDTIFQAQDVAEAIHYAVSVEGSARIVQLTAGSRINAEGEVARYLEILRKTDELVGIKNIPGGVMLYATASPNPADSDALFAAGVGWIACDMEIWDEKLAARICPGKYEWTGRQRHLDWLSHIARTQGPGKACCNFVVGLEPAESLLEGAEYLAGRGIVPIPSIWMPHGLPPIEGVTMPDLDYFRQVRKGLAAIYQKFQCHPAGKVGANVCLDRDIWNNLLEILGTA